MKTIIRLYYLFYVLSGGYRHYLYEFDFFKSISSSSLNLEQPLHLVENTLFILAIVLLLKPLSKSLNFFFFLFLLSMDIYFNNFIKFESAILGTHLFPLIAFLLLSRFSKKSVQSFSILIISIAFVTTALMKMQHGWLNLDNLVVYNHLVIYSKSYGLSTFLSPYLIGFKSFYFWKLLDYTVVFFQLSFLINFITQKYIAHQFLVAFFFHIGILMTLNIGIFFPYMLLYLLILYNIKQTIVTEKESIYGIGLLVLFALGFSFLIPDGTPHFFLELAPDSVYLYYEFIITLFIFIFGMIMFYKHFNLKQEN